MNGRNTISQNIWQAYPVELSPFSLEQPRVHERRGSSLQCWYTMLAFGKCSLQIQQKWAPQIQLRWLHPASFMTGLSHTGHLVINLWAAYALYWTSLPFEHAALPPACQGSPHLKQVAFEHFSQETFVLQKHLGFVRICSQSIVLQNLWSLLRLTITLCEREEYFYRASELRNNFKWLSLKDT